MRMVLKAQLTGGGVAAAICAAAFAHGVTNAHAPAPAAGGDVLARFKGGQINALDLKAAIANKDPDTQRHFVTPEGRIELLHNLETFDLLALEAERRGYAQNPDVIDTGRSAAIEQMLKADVRADPASIPAADVEREFEHVRANAPNSKKNLRFSDAEPKLRRQLAAAKTEQAREEFAKRLIEQSHPEVRPELVDPLELPSRPPLDQPQGFPAAPPDPRAPVQLTEQDAI